LERRLVAELVAGCRHVGVRAAEIVPTADNPPMLDTAAGFHFAIGMNNGCASTPLFEGVSDWR
jgi:hypothetical protein